MPAPSGHNTRTLGDIRECLTGRITVNQDLFLITSPPGTPRT
ncbi:hypothetical protein [Frankia sp. AiPs1]|nr:hypothetical protein [Frankia sp. AiPs1]